MTKPPRMQERTFSNLKSIRDDTSPPIEAMAASRDVEEPKRKNLVLRITPELKKALIKVSADTEETIENMAIELLEGLARKHGQLR